MSKVEIRDATLAPDELEARLIDVLDVHSKAAGYPFDPTSFGLEAWDGETFLGGAQYHFNNGWCFLKLLGVTQAHRKTGAGRMLMLALEVRMREQDAIGIWLDTFGFQAAPFYAGLGYEEFGRLSGPTPERDRIFMRKHLGEPR